MSKILSPTGIVTAVLLALVAFVVVVGGVVLLVDPDTLRPGGPFEAYLNDLKTFGVALGALGIGRGLHLGLTNHGQAISPSFNADPSDRAGASDHPNAPAP
jgi:hypothetical protein